MFAFRDGGGGADGITPTRVYANLLTNETSNVYAATVAWTMPDGSTVTTMPQGPVTPTIKHRDSRWAVSIAERRKRRINRAA